MSTTPQDLLANAQSLPDKTEVERRVKISRLYYALYSYACEFHDSLDSKGQLLKNGVGLHKQLSQKLTNPTVADPTLQALSREVGTKQQLAHEIRIVADYHLDAEVKQIMVVKCAKYAQDILKIALPKKAAA